MLFSSTLMFELEIFRQWSKFNSTYFIDTFRSSTVPSLEIMLCIRSCLSASEQKRTRSVLSCDYFRCVRYYELVVCGLRHRVFRRKLRRMNILSDFPDLLKLS